MASKDVFALLNKFVESESDKKTVVSSANDKIFSLVLFEMSFIYIRNSRGPKDGTLGDPASDWQVR